MTKRKNNAAEEDATKAEAEAAGPAGSDLSQADMVSQNPAGQPAGGGLSDLPPAGAVAPLVADDAAADHDPAAPAGVLGDGQAAQAAADAAEDPAAPGGGDPDGSNDITVDEQVDGVRAGIIGIAGDAAAAALKTDVQISEAFFDVLDLSPDIPHHGLERFVTFPADQPPSIPASFAVELAAEIAKAVYVGLQPWRQRQLDMIEELNRPPERPSRYEKAGERMGRVGEKIVGSAARRQAKGG